jgi:uncharacterized cupin superfamily protein
MSFTRGVFEGLGGEQFVGRVEPFMLTLENSANSGSRPMSHTGHEFVFCLKGRLLYTVEEQSFLLTAGDSLLFEAHLPHRWQNASEDAAQVLLVLCPADERDRPTERHFALKEASASGH